MILENNSKIVFIGDSVTDCSRARPIGEGLFGAEGNGYVSLIHAMIHAYYPEYSLRLINMGTSGNTVRDLKGRWQTDVIALKPDYVSIMIGVNDVWRQFDSPLMTENQVLLPEFTQTLDELVNATKPLVRQMILMTPFFIEPNESDLMKKTLRGYMSAVKTVAEKYGAIFADTQKEFDRILQFQPSASISWDRVHPNPTGHMIIAKTFLDAVGFNFNK